MATRTQKVIRSGVIGFVAGVSALGVAATAQPVHAIVSSAVGATDGHAREHDDDGRRGDRRWTPDPQQGQGADPWAQPQGQGGGDQWALPQSQGQADPYVQPAPQQAPQSQAS